MKSSLPLVLSLLFLASCARKSDEKVVVTEKTQSYHRENCAQVAMARTTSLTQTEAREKRYRPCPYCKPDQPQ